MLRKRLVVWSMVAISVTSVTALGQSIGDNGPGAFTIGVGTEAVGFRDGSKFDPAGLFQAGFERQLTTAFSLRLEGTVSSNTRVGYVKTESRTLSTYGLSLTPVYTMSLGKTRPYVLGSIGLDKPRLEASQLLATLPSGARASEVSYTTALTPTFGIGAGVNRRVGSSWLFVETRAEVFTKGENILRYRIPVTFGFRF